jgi:glycosyltransferase involved in cell wall biosynthesis
MVLRAREGGADGVRSAAARDPFALRLPRIASAACIPAIALLAAEQSASAREPLVLFVGSVFNRRHIPDLIRAFHPIAKSHPDARLELVGDNRTHPREDLPAIAAAAGIAPQVSIRAYVADAELARCMDERAHSRCCRNTKGLGILRSKRSPGSAAGIARH